ncbi:MAG: carboxypeptidase regulatory-like domain-containing protein, partial [Pedobacter sp.]
MTKKDTYLTKHTLRLKNCGLIAMALTLALCANFYSSAAASSAKLHKVNSIKKPQLDIVIRGIVKDSTGAPLPGAG